MVAEQAPILEQLKALLPGLSNTISQWLATVNQIAMCEGRINQLEGDRSQLTNVAHNWANTITRLNTIEQKIATHENEIRKIGQETNPKAGTHRSNTLINTKSIERLPPISTRKDFGVTKKRLIALVGGTQPMDQHHDMGRS